METSSRLVQASSLFAVIPAAGMSERMGSGLEGQSKVFLPLQDGRSVLEHTVRSLLDASVLDGLVLVVRDGDCQRGEELLESLALGGAFFARVIPGGKTRQESVLCGLRALWQRAKFVLVHDAARPLCPVSKIQEVVNKGMETGAALLAAPVVETLKRVDDSGLVLETIPRTRCYAAQTPQVFEYELLYQSYQLAEKKGVLATDDSELLERLGRPVSVVLGDACNIKLTTRNDVALANGILGLRG